MLASTAPKQVTNKLCAKALDFSAHHQSGGVDRNRTLAKHNFLTSMDEDYHPWSVYVSEMMVVENYGTFVHRTDNVSEFLNVKFGV